jgi:hypothetical protein
MVCGDRFPNEFVPAVPHRMLCVCVCVFHLFRYQLASAVASECGLRFISVKGPEILDKYIGASELAVCPCLPLAGVGELDGGHFVVCLSRTDSVVVCQSVRCGT